MSRKHVCRVNGFSFAFEVSHHIYVTNASFNSKDVKVENLQSLNLTLFDWSQQCSESRSLSGSFKDSSDGLSNRCKFSA